MKTKLLFAALAAFSAAGAAENPLWMVSFQNWRID